MHQRICLATSANPHLQLEEDAIVDTQVVVTRIPRRIANALALRKVDRRGVISPDGEMVEADYVGPLEVMALGRTTCTGAVVFGEEIIVGRIVLDGLDLVPDPARYGLMPNPANSDGPRSFAVGVREAA